VLGVEHQSLSFAPGATLYREGDLGRRLYVLQSGMVKLVTHLANGRSRIVGLEGPGSVLGLATSGDDVARFSHTAVALEATRCAVLTAGQVRHMRARADEEYVNLLEHGVEQASHAEHWLAEVLTENAPQRIARLIRLLARLNGPEADEIRLLTCQEVGEAVGISTESASRVLAQFKRDGVLRPSRRAGAGRWYYQVDRAALETMAFT
jgi:CRP-like cAMP-binding protein